MIKTLPAMQETWVQSLGWEDPLEKETATLSSILAWEMQWTEEPGRLQTMRLQKSQTQLSNYNTSLDCSACGDPSVWFLLWISLCFLQTRYTLSLMALSCTLQPQLTYLPYPFLPIQILCISYTVSKKSSQVILVHGDLSPSYLPNTCNSQILGGKQRKCNH